MTATLPLLLIVLHCARQTTSLSTIDMAHLVSAVRSHFAASSVLFLQTDNKTETGLYEEQILVHLQRAQSVVSASVLHANSPDFSSERPLRVLINSAAHHLAQVVESEQLWLLLPGATTVDKYLSEVFIPFNCEFLVAKEEAPEIVLTEVYHLSRGSRLRREYFGKWSNTTEFHQWPSPFLYERRNNLHGLKLRAAVNNMPPVVNVQGEGDKAVLQGGYFAELWHVLEDNLNFTTTYAVPVDRGWGSLENGVWNGMIGMVHRNEADVAISGIKMTSSRSEVVSYSQPLMFTSLRIFIREPDSTDNRWTKMVQVFTSLLWVAVLAMTITITICLILCHCCHRVDFFYHEVFFSVLGALCYQGWGSGSTLTSIKIVFVVMFLLAAVLLPAYSAALVSVLAAQQSELPFRDLEGMYQDGTYLLGVNDKSATFDIFTNHKDPLLYKYYTKLIAPDKDYLPLSVLEGMERVCNQPHYGFMTEYDFAVGLYDLLPCSPVVLPERLSTSCMALALTINSPFLGLINYNLHKIHAAGMMKLLYSRAWPVIFSHKEKVVIAVHVRDVALIIVLLFTSMAVSALILISELRLRNYRCNKRSVDRKCVRRKRFSP